MSTEIDVSDKETKLEPGSHVWITVNNLSVHVKHGEEGVSVTIYPLDREMSDSIAETWVTFDEAGLALTGAEFQEGGSDV